MLDLARFLLSMQLGSCAALAQLPETKPTADPEASSFKRFAPGVRIDWKARAVEVEAEVALREGPLELLVCGLNTREHESVFVAKARPMHIFQALGLLGLEPGQPVRYDKEKDRMLPPTGDFIDIRVRFADGTLHAAEAFLRQTSDHQQPAPLKWVFAGSRLFPDGRFAADEEGTIACVVDFDSALVALNVPHSSDNEILWLEANPESIPKRGTPCSILFSPVKKPDDRVLIGVDGAGRLSRDGEALSIESVVRIVRDGPIGRSIHLQPQSGVQADVVEGVRRAVIGAGVDAEKVIIAAPRPKDERPEKQGGIP